MKKFRNFAYEWLPALLMLAGLAAVVFMVRPPA